MKPVTRPPVVRPIVDADFAQWLPLWIGYNTFYKRTLPNEVTRKTWARFLDPGEPMHALVAERAGQLLGFAHYLFHRSTIHIELICYLQDLFTVESARGQGIGRALIEAVAARARAAGAARVYWLTHETNHAARQLYDKVASNSGFIVYRRQL